MDTDLKTPHKNYVSLFPSTLNIPSEAAAAAIGADARLGSATARGSGIGARKQISSER